MLSTLHKLEVPGHPKAQRGTGSFPSFFPQHKPEQSGIIFYHQIRAGYWKVKSLTFTQENLPREQTAYSLQKSQTHPVASNIKVQLHSNPCHKHCSSTLEVSLQRHHCQNYQFMLSNSILRAYWSSIFFILNMQSIEISQR